MSTFPDGNLKKQVADAEARCTQLSTNFKWVLAALEEITEIVDPQYIGVWQDKARHAVKRVKELKHAADAASLKRVC